MTLLQKTVKYIAIIIAILLTVSIISGILGVVGIIGGIADGNAVSDSIKTYSLSDGIASLKIDINYADFKLSESTEFALESNLKDLKVKQQNGALVITHNKKSFENYNKAVLTLFVPKDFVFDKAEIKTGAARFTAESISADELSLDFGAGKVSIDSLNASRECEIDSGVGEVSINGGNICNLDFDMGVGAVDITCALSGDSEFDCGVGEANIKIIGKKESYGISVDKGIGDIKIDGQTVSDGIFSTYTENMIEINSGVGSVNVTFED